MHVVAVEWLSLKETGADEQVSQLTAEGNHDCCSLQETLLLNEQIVAVFSLYRISWRKKMKRRGEG